MYAFSASRPHSLTKAIILFGVLALVTLNTFGQTTDSIGSKELNDLVITGQYGENSMKNSVYKVHIIDQKRILMLGAVNLKDVLANEMNIRVYYDPATGSSNITLQGVTGQNIKILIDGIPVTGREGGNIDLNQINLANVERIEIVEGPMSVSFGTDALGGVINIISKKPTRNQAGAHGFLFYETTGQYNINAGTELASKNASIQLNAGRNFFDGFGRDETHTRFRIWKPREQYVFDANIGYSTKAGNFRWQNSFFNERVINRDSGVITPYYAYGLDEYYRSRRITSALFYDRKVNANIGINILGSIAHYRRIRNTMRKDLVTLNEEMSSGPDQHDTTFINQLMSRGTFTRNKQRGKLNYQLGYELNYEYSSGGRIEGDGKDIADYNLFASAEYKPVVRLTLRPGVRAIYNTRFTAPLVPSVNIKYDLTDRIRIRTSYARGFRAPSLKELYLSFYDQRHNIHGNADLTAEKGNNLQLSASYEVVRMKHMFRVEPSLFYNHINDMIDLVVVNSSTAEATYINVSEFTSKGSGISAEYKTPVYSLQLGYMYTGRHSSYSPDERFLFSNEYRVNFNITHPKRNTSLGIFVKYNGKVQSYQYNYIRNVIEAGYINPFTLFDLSFSQPFFSKRLQVTAGARNLLNVTDVNASISGGIHQSGSGNASIAMGRSYFMSLRFNISKLL